MATTLSTPVPTIPARGCGHKPPCPSADATDHASAVAIAHDYTAGCSLLCNGVIMFDDTGELVPDGEGVRPVDPHRGPAPHRR